MPPVPPAPDPRGGISGWLALVATLAALVLSVWAGWLPRDVLAGVVLAEALRAAVAALPRRRPTPPADERGDTGAG